MICELRFTISNEEDGGASVVVGQAFCLSSGANDPNTSLDRRDACPTILPT
jgi:hypothetical protein